MFDVSTLQSLSKILFQSYNIFLLLFLFAIYNFTQYKGFTYKYTALGFLFGLMALPVFGGIFALLNKYGIISLSLLYTIFVFVMIKIGFSINKSVIYSIALLISFLLLSYLHFIPISFFENDKNAFTILALLSVVYGVIYALLGYLLDIYVPIW